MDQNAAHPQYAEVLLTRRWLTSELGAITDACTITPDTRGFIPCRMRCGSITLPEVAARIFSPGGLCEDCMEKTQ